MRTVDRDDPIGLCSIVAIGNHRKVQFDTPVFERAHVLRERGEAQRRSQRDLRHGVFRVFDIVLGACGQPAFEQRSFEARVPRRGLLPFQVVVAQGYQLNARGVGREVVTHQVRIGIYMPRLVRSETLRTGNAVSDRKHQIVEPGFLTFHELLVHDIPFDARRPERREPVVLAELRRTVDADIGVERITVFVGVTYGQHTADTARRVLRAGHVLAVFLTEKDVVHGIVGESGDFGPVGFIPGLVDRIAEIRRDEMCIADRLVVHHREIHGIVERFGLRAREVAFERRVGHVVESRVIARTENLGFARVFADGNVPLKNPRLRGAVFEFEKVAHGKVRIAIETMKCRIVERIGHFISVSGTTAVGHVPCLHDLVDVAVFVVRPQVGIQRSIVAE